MQESRSMTELNKSNAEGSVNGMVKPESTRLGQWLHETLDNGQLGGLSWVDRDQRVFRIVWTDDEEDSGDMNVLLHDELCRVWAAETRGHGKGGTAQPQHALGGKLWRIQLHLAVSSSPELQQLQPETRVQQHEAESLKHGDETTQWRVYKFVNMKGAGAAAQLTSVEAGTAMTTPHEMGAVVDEQVKAAYDRLSAADFRPFSGVLEDIPVAQVAESSAGVNFQVPANAGGEPTKNLSVNGVERQPPRNNRPEAKVHPSVRPPTEQHI